MADYERFLAVRRCPVYEFIGQSAHVPDEYAAALFGQQFKQIDEDYQPAPFLFDYQRDISRLAIHKQRFSAFVECGLGKTLIFLEFARHALKAMQYDKPVLIVSPLMVIPQTIAEAAHFYPGLEIVPLRGPQLQEFLHRGNGIGITNFEALTPELRAGNLGCLIIDESSMLKSAYGKWGQVLLAIGAGLTWKLCLTGTPAPNDRVEFANHAIFMEQCTTVNAFLAKYFVNKGSKKGGWQMMGHALDAFYRDLSHWSIFLSNPATYGWKDNSENIPPINVHVHRVEMTEQQRKLSQKLTGSLFVGDVGGIGNRSKLGQIAKGKHNGEQIETNKIEYIHDMVKGFTAGGESTIIWCIYNDEQDRIAQAFPGAANIDGKTPLWRRLELIEAFKKGQIPELISKAALIGFGLNLQRATRQMFSGIQDSYEKYWQCVKRSNRVGSDKPLNAHIPITDIEEPMAQNVLRKAVRVQQDTEEQERRFKKNAWIRF